MYSAHATPRSHTAQLRLTPTSVCYYRATWSRYRGSDVARSRVPEPFPLVAGVFYPFTLSPEIAALVMSGSSALAAINALMLKH